MFPLSLHDYIEILALLTGVICWYRIKTTRLKWIVPFLAFIVIAELTGRYVGRELHHSVGWIYNLSVPIEYIFFSYLFFIHYTGKIYKGISFIFCISFGCFAVLFSLLYGIKDFHYIYLKMGSVMMIIVTCFYFSDILSNERIVNPVRIPMFWIASALLLFNTGEFMQNFFLDRLSSNMPEWYKVFKLINNNLIVVLYSCIAIAIIITTWKHKEPA